MEIHSCHKSDTMSHQTNIQHNVMQNRNNHAFWLARHTKMIQGVFSAPEGNQITSRH